MRGDWKVAEPAVEAEEQGFVYAGMVTSPEFDAASMPHACSLWSEEANSGTASFSDAEDTAPPSEGPLTSVEDAEWDFDDEVWVCPPRSSEAEPEPAQADDGVEE